MARIALVMPATLEKEFAAEAERDGHQIVARCPAASDLLPQLKRLEVDCIVVSATKDCLTEELLAESDSIGVRVIGLVGSEIERHHAAVIGLEEVSESTAGWRQLGQLLDVTLVEHPVQPPRPSSVGRVLAVWGPAGAPGRTTLAVNIAAELAAAGFSVALVDADTYSGSVAPVLGLLDEAPGFAAACRLAGSDNLSLTELDRVSQRYRSAQGDFLVLTGIGRPSRWPELSSARVTATLKVCRQWVDYTIADTGFSLESDEEISSDLFAPRRNAATRATLEEADRVIAVGSADPVGLSRFLRAHVDLVQIVAAERVTVAMNKVRSAVIGLNPSGQVVQVLSRFGGITDPVLIPHDGAALDAAILRGKTLLEVAPKSPVRSAIRQLARSQCAVGERSEFG